MKAKESRGATLTLVNTVLAIALSLPQGWSVWRHNDHEARLQRVERGRVDVSAR